MMASDADRLAFQDRYGPWALVVGGSDGLGAALADEVAATGINLVLVARNPEKLDRATAQLHGRHGVDVRTEIIDLEDEDAAVRLAEATRALEIGLVIYNAGADTSGTNFIDLPLEDWQRIVRRNVGTFTAALHHFAGRLAKAGRGGMLLVSSEAAYGGGGRVGIYSATKGYGLNLGESLWAELRPFGVYVLNLVFAIADTPTLRGVLAAHDIPVEATGASNTAELARAALASMDQGPTFVWQHEDDGTDPLRSASLRRERCSTTTAMMAQFYGAGTA